MTVKELKEKLAEYPDEMRVKLAVGWNMEQLISFPVSLIKLLQNIATVRILKSALSVKMCIGARRLSEYAMDEDWI